MDLSDKDFVSILSVPVACEILGTGWIGRGSEQAGESSGKGNVGARKGW